MAKVVLENQIPILVTLESGPFAWCACGKSSNQPFCDGTYRGTKFSLVLFKIAEKRDAWLCQCKNSKNAPFCDKTHNGQKPRVNVQK